MFGYFSANATGARPAGTFPIVDDETPAPRGGMPSMLSTAVMPGAPVGMPTGYPSAPGPSGGGPLAMSTMRQVGPFQSLASGVQVGRPWLDPIKVAPRLPSPPVAPGPTVVPVVHPDSVYRKSRRMARKMRQARKARRVGAYQETGDLETDLEVIEYMPWYKRPIVLLAGAGIAAYYFFFRR